MNPNIKAVRYYNGNFRLGILVRDDERWQYIIPITVNKEIRVVKYKVWGTPDVVTEYLDEATLKSLAAKILELGKKYGISEEARRWLV